MKYQCNDCKLIFNETKTWGGETCPECDGELHPILEVNTEFMKYYWCEFCDYRWKTEKEPKTCPKCKSIEFRQTMSEEEAKKEGLL